MALTAGTSLTPSLRLAQPLGDPKSKHLFLAEHATLHLRVVVKLLSPERTPTAEQAARFARDAAALSQVPSPHLPRIFDHGVAARGGPYVVMEHVVGPDLASLGARPLEEVVELVAAVAHALQRAHERDVVHGDVRAEHVLVADTLGGRPFFKLVGFRLAEPRAHQTSGDDLLGLSRLVHQALTGALPDPKKQAQKPSATIASLPPSIDAWFERALSRDASQRFSSADEMARSFRAAASNKGRALERTGTIVGTPAMPPPPSSGEAITVRRVSSIGEPPAGAHGLDEAWGAPPSTPPPSKKRSMRPSSAKARASKAPPPGARPPPLTRKSATPDPKSDRPQPPPIPRTSSPGSAPKPPPIPRASTKESKQQQGPNSMPPIDVDESDLVE